MADTASCEEGVWTTPAKHPTLAKNAVHVWRTILDADETHVLSSRAVLSTDEQARADRFLRQEHGRRFTLGRAVLRALIARYVGTTPESVVFAYNEQKKPFLKDDCAKEKLQFNVSNSGEVAVFAFTWNRAIGVDIEAIEERLELEKIATRYFSPFEVKQLFELPENERMNAFYRCWTRKEAYIKARGGGLTIPLDSFDVSLVPGHTPQLLRADDLAGPIDAWNLRELKPAEHYAGALAVEGAVNTVSQWQADVESLVP